MFGKASEALRSWTGGRLLAESSLKVNHFVTIGVIRLQRLQLLPRCLPLLLLFFPLLAEEIPEPAWQYGALKVKPFGFLEVIGMSRSQTTPDSVSTHFGSIPLNDTPEETIASIAHSRVMLKSDYGLTPGSRVSVYLESDFLNPKSNSAPWHWRQYWGAIRFGNWELLGGQGWSLLRPNRTGILSEKNLMNTDVIDPAYHVGIVGVRRRQVRLTGSLKKQTVAIDWEANGDFEAKLATDRGFGHVEIAALTGHAGRRALQVSTVLRAGQRLRLISQQYLARRSLNEALSLVSAGVGGFSTLEGVEVQATKQLEVYSYAGLIYSERSAGNRLVRQYSSGFNWQRPVHTLHGYMTLSLQYSYLDRAVWDGRTGTMQFLMSRVRYTLP